MVMVEGATEEAEEVELEMEADVSSSRLMLRGVCGLSGRDLRMRSGSEGRWWIRGSMRPLREGKLLCLSRMWKWAGSERSEILGRSSVGVWGDTGESRVRVDVLLGATEDEMERAGGRRGERAGSCGGEKERRGDTGGVPVPLPISALVAMRPERGRDEKEMEMKERKRKAKRKRKQTPI